MRTGGVGSNIARVVAETYPVPMRVLCHPRRLPGHRVSPAEIMQDCGLTAEDMAGAARAVIAVKRGA